MIRSMTGFGKGEARLKSGVVTVELKTVNHKFFELAAKFPESLVPYEERIKDILQRKIHRGKINLTISIDGVSAKADDVKVNLPLARSYYGKLKKLNKDLSLNSTLDIYNLVSLPGVLSCVTAGDCISVQMWVKVKEALDQATSRLLKDREKEGKALYTDLIKRANLMSKMMAVIKNRAKLNIGEYKKKFADRVKMLTNGRPLDAGRLEMEAAIYAKNCDIAEEITRLESHIGHFKKTISSSGETGKKLDFIAQEMHREINTIGAKASDIGISKNVINIKSEVEKIREQVKNLE